MNRLDRAIAAVAPRYALKRAAARMRLRYIEEGRHGSDWDRNTGKVADALPMRPMQRRRILNTIATNPYAAKAKSALLNNLVGYGITGTPRRGVPKKVVEQWKLFVDNADWLGELDLYGIQDLSIGTMVADGEVFIIRRFEKDSYRRGTGIGLRLQVLDQDMLDDGAKGGPIEYDDDGRPTFYNFRACRRGERGSHVYRKPERIPAEHVIHLFRREWPGQMRGRSLFEPVIKRYEDLDEYIDAEVVRKKIEACFVGFIQPNIEVGDQPLGETDGELSASGNSFELETFEPGMLERLNPGETVTFGDPKPTVGMSEFARVTLLGATAGVGVTYEHGTGDLSNVNYSSYRAGGLEFQRFCGRIQWLTIIPTCLRRIWQWFLQDGYESGVFARNDYGIDWTPPAFESLDRGKDAKGIVAELKAGLTSRRREVAARGFDHDDLLKEIAADREAQSELGLSFDGDPGSTTSRSKTDAETA